MRITEAEYLQNNIGFFRSGEKTGLDRVGLIFAFIVY